MNSIGPVMQAGVSYSHLSQKLCHSITSNEGRNARANETELHVTFCCSLRSYSRGYHLNAMDIPRHTSGGFKCRWMKLSLPLYFVLEHSELSSRMEKFRCVSHAT